MPTRWKSAPERGLLYADRADGIRVYGIRVQEGGKDRKRTVGISKEAALQALGKVRRDRERVKLGERTGEKPPPPVVTLGQLWDLYREEMTDLASGPENARYARVWLEALGADRDVSTIRPGDVREWMRAKRKELTRFGRPHSPASINRHLAMLRRLFSLASRDERTTVQPVPRGTLLQENNKRRRQMTHEEEARLAPLASRSLWLHVQLALATGLRRTEQATLRRDDLDEARAILRVRSSKGHEDEFMPLHPQAVELLQQALSRHREERVFPGLQPISLSRRFARLCKRAGVRDLRWHDLRRTFCSRLAEAGVPREVIQELARHRSPQMTDRYRYLSTGRLREHLLRLPLPGSRTGSPSLALAKYPGRRVVTAHGR